MKKISKILIPMLVLASLLIGACAGVSAPASFPGGGKVDAALVDFTGVIESITGDQWVVSGQTITVDPAIVRDGPYNVGDTIKVEAQVEADGSVVVTRVEAPVAVDNSNDDNSNSSNSNDSNSNDDNSNDSNSNDDNSNDDDSNSNSDDDDDDDNSNSSNSNSSNSNDDDDDDDNGNGSNSNDSNSNDDDDDDSNDNGSSSNGNDNSNGTGG